MDWRIRASALRLMAANRGGVALYQVLQRWFGTHRDTGILRGKLRHQLALVERVREQGVDIRGAHMVEVGTGWVPLLPIGFWLLGASSVHTFDLHRYLIPGAFRRALKWLGGQEDELVELWRDVEEPDAIRRRLSIVRELEAQPMRLLDHANIDYRAPADVAASGLRSESIDVHYSLSVFEHIAPSAIPPILREADRILKPTGVAVHQIDPSDHFSNFDAAISRINFLRFDDDQWSRIAGNDLAYHNRLRHGDFRRLFGESELEVVDCHSTVNPKSMRALEEGLPLAVRFGAIDREELCRERVRVVARRGSGATLPCSDQAGDELESAASGK